MVPLHSITVHLDKILHFHIIEKITTGGFMKSPQETYASIIEAVHFAVDAEQPEGGPYPYKEETEKCLHVVYVLLREALGITDPDA